MDSLRLRSYIRLLGSLPVFDPLASLGFHSRTPPLLDGGVCVGPANANENAYEKHSHLCITGSQKSTAMLGEVTGHLSTGMPNMNDGA